MSQSEPRSVGSGLQAPTIDRGKGWLILQNVNGFTPERAEEIKAFMGSDQGGCAVMLLTELNVDWRRSQHSLAAMMRGQVKVQRHVVAAHNVTERASMSLYQPGGVAIISFGAAASRVIGSEKDPTGLGRWCSVQFQLGSSQLWIIVVYRPCVAPGQDTVYQQHRRHLGDRDPREAIMDELGAVIARYREQGSMVVVGGDFNEDVRTLRIHGLKECITSFDSGPTHQRGSVPIDGFFASRSVPVQSGGLLPFYHMVASDHTAVWCATPLFVQQPSRPQPIRRLQLSNQTTVDKYLNHIRAHWHDELDDQQALDLLVKAERSCRRLRTGGFQYSPELSTSLIEVRVWRLRIKRKEGHRVAIPLLRRMERKCGLTDGDRVLSMNLEELKRGLSHAREAGKAVRQAHYQLRDSHLQRCSISRPELDAMRERERGRAVFRRLREAIPSKSRRPLHLVRDIDGTWKDTEEGIFYSVMEENERRFTQTRTTPLRVDPLLSLLGDLADTSAADAVLEGNFVAPINADPTFVALLPFLRRPARVDDLNIFTVESFRKGWKKMGEFTGCQGPLHFGHFKAIASDPILSEWASLRLSKAFGTGVPAQDWLVGTDIMIEKKAGVYDVDKLRTILLFHPEFNFGNKAIGRSMMGQAERLDLMPEAQYGSRHGKSASIQVLNKVLLFELSRVQYVPLGYCSTDAKSCYDRIVHSFAALAMRRLGVPKAVTVAMFSVIKDMVHHVRTGFGDSDWSYSCPPTQPFQGVGQGNGAGPAIWAAVSAPLLAFLHSKRNGARFTSPISNESTCISAMAFVDDTDLIGGLETSSSSLDEDLMHVLQSQVDEWAKALRVSGGAIVPEKSFYWRINYIMGKMQIAAEGPSLSAINDSGNQGQVPFVSPASSRKTLGLLINPKGTWKDQRDKMRAAMELWSETSKVANLSRYDAMVELKIRVLPKVLYGLESTSFHERDCRYIMAPAIQTGLQLCGTTRVLPREIVYGPASVLGLEVQNLYVAQGLKHLNVLLFYGPMDTSATGILIRCLMEEATLLVGLGNYLLKCNFEVYGHLLASGWVKTLWSFCYEHSIQVEDWLPPISLLRDKDRYLIEVAQGLLTQRDRSSLKSFNKCRLFLKVVTLADITQGNGRAICKGFLKGERLKWTYREAITFAASYPSSADWAVWRGLLKRMFPLVQPLGRWYSHSPRPCCLSESGLQLFLKRPLGWSQHEILTIALRRVRFSTSGAQIDDLPEGTCRTMVEEGHNGYVCWGSDKEMMAPSTSQGAPSLIELYSERFGSTAQAFNCGGGFITICSDGSFKDQRGTASWIAVAGEQETGQDLVVPDGVHSAYRSELAGILGGLQFLDSLAGLALPQEVRFVCDGLSALNMAFGLLPIQISTAQHDMLKEIRRLRASVLAKGVRLLPVHVKGHADDNTSAAELTPDEALNVRMDDRAKAFWITINIRGWPLSRLANSCTARWEDVFVSCRDLQEKIPAKALYDYWTTTKRIPSTGLVDWASLATATQSVRRGKSVFLTKFFSGFCGVNRWLKIWGLTQSATCQRCQAAVETTAHLWTCSAPEACTLRDRLFDELIIWIRRKRGNSRFSQTVRSVINALKNQANIDLSSIPVEFRQAVVAQTVIGWDNFLMGCWSIEWSNRLRAEDEEQEIFRLPERVIAAIIARLWEISWDLWLGRNAAVYPNSEISAEGDTIQRSIIPTRLCRVERRRKRDGVAQSSALMRQWLSRASSKT